MEHSNNLSTRSIGEWILIFLCAIDGCCTLILIGIYIGIIMCSPLDNNLASKQNDSLIFSGVTSESSNFSSPSTIDLSGVWTGNIAVESYQYIQYLYFGPDGVYYMASTAGKPLPSDFTNSHKIANSYTISESGSGHATCSFDGYTVTIDNSETIHVSGKIISGTYHR